MSIIYWIILGGLAGWIASALAGSPGGCLTDIIVGIVGAMIGGVVFPLIGGAPDSGFNLWSLFVAVFGSIILIAIVRATRRAGWPGRPGCRSAQTGATSCSNPARTGRLEV